MDIGGFIEIVKNSGGLILAIAILTSTFEVVFNLVVNKVFLEPFVTRWGSRYSRKIIPYVLSKLEPIAPDLMKDWSPSEIEEKLFDEIINAPGAPQWSKKPVLSKKEQKEIRKIYYDLVKEFDFVKASDRCTPNRVKSNLSEHTSKKS